jgi:hypothetical protein
MATSNRALQARGHAPRKLSLHRDLPRAIGLPRTHVGCDRQAPAVRARLTLV